MEIWIRNLLYCQMRELHIRKPVSAYLAYSKYVCSDSHKLQPFGYKSTEWSCNFLAFADAFPGVFLFLLLYRGYWIFWLLVHLFPSTLDKFMLSYHEMLNKWLQDFLSNSCIIFGVALSDDYCTFCSAASRSLNVHGQTWQLQWGRKMSLALKKLWAGFSRCQTEILEISTVR